LLLAAGEKRSADGDFFGLEGLGIDQAECRLTVLAEEFSRVDQQAIADPFDLVGVVVPATDDIEMPGEGETSGQLRIVVKGDAPAARLDRPPDPVVGNGWKPIVAESAYQVHVAYVVAIYQMDRTVESGKFLKHEGGDQVTAMDKQKGSFLVAEGDGAAKIGNVVVGI